MATETNVVMNKEEELAVAEALSQLRSHEGGSERAPRADSEPDTAATLPPYTPLAPASIAATANRSADGKQLSRILTRDSSLHDASGAHIATAAPADVLPTAIGSIPPTEPGAQSVLAQDTLAAAQSHVHRQPSQGLPSPDHQLSPLPQPEQQQRQPQQQPPWRNVLLTATSLMLTRDARRKIRQLLGVLRLASEHLNARANALKAAMQRDASQDHVEPRLSKAAIRSDIITTIKKCVVLLSTLATNSLPAGARERVRNTILKLPSRWASQLENNDRVPSESAALALATEMLVSIQNITTILSETMDRADSWVERLPKFSLGKRSRETEEDAPAPGTIAPGESRAPGAPATAVATAATGPAASAPAFSASGPSSPEVSPREATVHTSYSPDALSLSSISPTASELSSKTTVIAPVVSAGDVKAPTSATASQEPAMPVSNVVKQEATESTKQPPAKPAPKAVRSRRVERRRGRKT